MAAAALSRTRSIAWFRWVGLVLLAAAILTFLTAVALELSAPGAPRNRPFFWTAVACNLSCLVGLPLLLFRAIRLRQLERKAWRAVLMRAIWGGPFGTLGALWDLTAEPLEGEASKP
jgi:hypothetical protein